MHVGKNNQGLKQVCSKFSPAWALHFSVSQDTEGKERESIHRNVCPTVNAHTATMLATAPVGVNDIAMGKPV